MDEEQQATKLIDCPAADAMERMSENVYMMDQRFIREDYLIDTL